METKTSSQWLFTPTDHILKSHLHSLGFLQRLLMSCNFFSFFLFPFVFIGFLGLGYPLFFCFFFFVFSFLFTLVFGFGLYTHRLQAPNPFKDYKHQTHSTDIPIQQIGTNNTHSTDIPIQPIYPFKQNNTHKKSLQISLIKLKGSMKNQALMTVG